MKTFVHTAFLVPADVHARNLYSEFEFGPELAAFRARTKITDGSWYIPMDISKLLDSRRFRTLI